MAADVPFGLSFGDPRRYMGQSPLAEIGKALKTGLVGYAIQESGLEKMLNEKGVKKTNLGNYQYGVPQGSVPPVNAPVRAVAPNASVPAPVNPNATPTFNAPPAQVTVTPVIDYGAKILDNDYDGDEQSFVNPQAQRDFNPYMLPTTPNPVALTGNEYQQMPGYGKLAKFAQSMMG
jgi:hypothetical protein